MGANADALAKLPAAQVREMREGFQTLDRDSDGQVNREDVVDMLTNLGRSFPSRTSYGQTADQPIVGQEASPSTVSQFFPPGAPQSLSMPSFLHTLSSLLGPLSSQQELVNAFAAFDDDDSGQIDVGELRDALLHTSVESGERPLSEREVNQVMGGFKGRREFARGVGAGQRGEVFRYQDFIANVMGNESSEKAEQGN